MKKILPVSLLAIWIACPALAENFPNDGYMLENKTYDNAATYENMGVYSDSVEANAYYDDCPANSYCDESGQHQCPSGYPYSATGAGASTECYKACTTANVPHSYAVTGNDYNGGTDTCSATSCVAGYHVYNSSVSLATLIGNNDDIKTAYIDHWGNTSGGVWNSASGDVADYGISDNDSFVIDYGGLGFITGHGRCSTQSGTSNLQEVTVLETLTGNPEDYGAKGCYCQLDGFTSVGGIRQNLSSSWVFSYYEVEGGEVCLYMCSSDCAYWFVNNPLFRSTILGTNMVNGPATCAANTITINWSDVDDDGSATTLATDVLYDGDIDTPVKAATYPGKIFTGWRFVAPEEEGGS